MPRRNRTHILDSATPPELLPKHLTKQEFGRRIYNLMVAKGWTQSELARQSGLPRDRISNYVRGVALPTPTNVHSLAASFGVEPESLLPNHTEQAIGDDTPSFDMKTSTSAPGKAWLRVNRLVLFSTAVKIAELLEQDAGATK